jgi:CRISPR-associated protein Cas8b1/Cst1 subtype I-B
MNSIVKDDIANLVRNYVHYDNLVISLHKQTNNARIVRDDFEKRIIDELKKNKLENAIIQIVGGKLKVVEEKHSNPLSYKFLEEQIHNYFVDNHKTDETRDILQYIKSHKNVMTELKLKKIPQLPPQPASQ